MLTRLDLTADEVAELVAQAPTHVAEVLVRLLALLAQQEQTVAQRDQTIAQLLQSNSQLQLTIEQLTRDVATLTARLHELDDRNNRDSHNSHQPPASDGFKKKPRSLRGRSNKQPGAQAGHTGHTLTLSDQPDIQLLHRPANCPCCDASLADVPAHSTQRRQVVDLPPLMLLTTEHIVESLVCPHCQQICAGSFPSEASEPLQYGPNIAALVVYLRTYQLLPSARTQELLADLFGQAPSEGTLDNMLNTAADTLAPVVEHIRAELLAAAVLHVDETGCYVEDKRYWLHVACTAQLTYYQVHAKRGYAGSKAAGVLPEFDGVAIHDSYAPYWEYSCEHALCNAHILRELLFVAERTGQAWAGALAELLREMLAATNQAWEKKLLCLDSEQVADYERRYDESVSAGLALNPAAARPEGQKRGRVKQSPARNLLLRLRDHRAEVLRFMHDLRVPFDNNQAERDIRMMKVQQKISGRFRTKRGAEVFCRIRSYISTMRKQGLHLLSALQQVFRGAPTLPATSG